MITTAGIYDKNSIWWRLRSKATQISEGTVVDNTFLPILYIADQEKDDLDSEETWRKVNPSLGQIFSLDKIRHDWQSARQNPIDYQNFLRFRLNVPIRDLQKWMPMDAWDMCSREPDTDKLTSRACFGGLDLSSRLDLSALVLVFPPLDGDDMYDILCRFYCPHEGIYDRGRRDKVPYEIWQKQGFLTATPGNVVDYAQIEGDICVLATKYRLLQIGYDTWNAQATATRIMERLNPTHDPDGFQMVEIRQGARTLNEPARDLLTHVLTSNVRHGGHPVLRWHADNLVMRSDVNGNIAPDRKNSTEKIDGMVALIMAWSRAMADNTSAESVYENRGILTL